MLNHFSNVSKPAIKYVKHSRMISKSFKEFYQDIYKMIALFLKYQLKPQDKVGVFVFPYSYSFYVLFFASLLYQVNLVVFDSYKKKHIQELMKMEEVSYCFTSNQTKWISHFVLPKCKKINSSEYASFQPFEQFECVTNQDSIILTTFTSGTTGRPKPIYRSLDFLLKQAFEIQNEIDLKEVSIIFGGLPIYNVLSLYLLKTTCISKNLKYLEKFQADCVLTNIYSLLKERRSHPFVKEVMIGGAILYSSEARKLKECFPNATITYIYGASEGAILYKTNLDFYQKHPFTFDIMAKEIEVSIVNPNNEGIGEIVIQGEKVNTMSHVHYTGDLGHITDGKLMIVGRKKYSSLDLNFYNYVFDESLRKENNIKAFSLYYKDKIYVVSTKKIKRQQKNITYITMHHLPMDLKHQTKLNYKECLNKIEKMHK